MSRFSRFPWGVRFNGATTHVEDADGLAVALVRARKGADNAPLIAAAPALLQLAEYVATQAHATYCGEGVRCVRCEARALLSVIHFGE